ncbi:hypothetical protein CC78DRAFT_548628 [Lojkania enalia]|uniref:Uncharacterized protein n=1 Tax=Lojkania enalia TaxID=147567 RepID=A0A9P4K087_9PLEO|nr:hypothetical protein CC78DRAFT_548628 [Didymosphaeria enalia]
MTPMNSPSNTGSDTSVTGTGSFKSSDTVEGFAAYLGKGDELRTTIASTETGRRQASERSNRPPGCVSAVSLRQGHQQHGRTGGKYQTEGAGHSPPRDAPKNATGDLECVGVAQQQHGKAGAAEQTGRGLLERSMGTGERGAGRKSSEQNAERRGKRAEGSGQREREQTTAGTRHVRNAARACPIQRPVDRQGWCSRAATEPNPAQ